MVRSSFTWLYLAIALVGSGCDSPTADPVFDLVLPVSALELQLGESFPVPPHLTRDGLDVTDEPFSFAVLPAAVVSVDPDGTLRAIGMGSATITVAAHGQTASFTVTVVSGPPTELRPDVSSVALTSLGDSTQLSVQTRNRFGALIPATLEWRVRDGTIASVTSSGLVRALANGTTVVTASTGGIATDVEVTVAQIVRSIRVETASGGSTQVAQGDTLRMRVSGADARGHPVAGLDSRVQWRTDDANVAVVDSQGLVHGQSVGRTMVRATISAPPATQDAISGAVEIVVVPPVVASIALSPSSLTLSRGEVTQLVAIARDINGAVLAVSIAWTSSDTRVATVDGSGVATGVGGGTATIQASAGGKSGSATVQVPNSAPAAPTVTAGSITTSAATLGSSPFADPDPGATHTASEWEVVSAGTLTWKPLIAGSGVTTTNLTSFVVTGLDAGAQYWARVRYRDEKGAFGPFGNVVFTTAQIPSRAPNTPTFVVTGTTPTTVSFESSRFSDPDAVDTHGSSEWQVDELYGDWLSLVATTVSRTDLTTWTATGLAPSTRYQVRVRYQDDKGRLSGFSPALVVTTPAIPEGDLRWTRISTGEGFACGLVADGRAFCWGRGDMLGRLGESDSPYPVALETDQRFTSIGSGNQIACASSVAGPGYCWGSWGLLGDGLNDGQRSNLYRPVRVVDVDQFSKMMAGTNYGCGLDAAGASYCWGYNNKGQLGFVTTTDIHAPVPGRIVGGMVFADLFPGDQHTCAVTPAGKGYCWGGGDQGELGSLPVLESSTSPVEIDGGLTWRTIVPRGNATVGITTDGRLYVWGRFGTIRNVPTEVPTNLRFEDVTAGYEFGCGLASGKAYCWGRGYSTVPSASLPSIVPMAGDRTYVSISAWYGNVCALATDGDAWCWGSATRGELGNGSTNNTTYEKPTPVRVSRPR